jgi:D-glycero-D-manno-heptose 1,7-bisphosphate phosphatase
MAAKPGVSGEDDVLIKQAVILCGGMGTRLGALTAATPKPLLPVGNQPFLQILIQEVARSGVREFLLLAGHMADQVVAFAEAATAHFGGALAIDVAAEGAPAGTGGALFEACGHLAPEFLLLNGDSFLDMQLGRLATCLAAEPEAAAAIALREVEDSGRYGSVHVEGSRVVRFEEKNLGASAGLINGGIYAFRRDALLPLLRPVCSLERDVLPVLAAQGKLHGVEADGFFIDIGLPETFAQAQQELIAHRRRPAIFFDRDGVLNRDHGHVGTVDRFEWTDGAIEAIRVANVHGYYAFVVTNQAGVAKGRYELDDYWHLRDHIRAELAAYGAQIDDERFCPFHPEGTVPEFRRSSPDRKPAPGMINDLLLRWPVEREGSFFVGDQPTDLEAAAAAALPGYHFEGGNLAVFVRDLLSEREKPAS